MEESKQKINALRQLIIKYGPKVKNSDDLSDAKRAICKEFALDFVLNSELLAKSFEKMTAQERKNFG